MKILFSIVFVGLAMTGFAQKKSNKLPEGLKQGRCLIGLQLADDKYEEMLPKVKEDFEETGLNVVKIINFGNDLMKMRDRYQELLSELEGNTFDYRIDFTFINKKKLVGTPGQAGSYYGKNQQVKMIISKVADGDISKPPTDIRVIDVATYDQAIRKLKKFLAESCSIN